MNWGNQKICRFSHGQVWTLEVGHRGRDGVMIIFRPGGHRIVPSGNETWPEKHQFIFHLWKLSYFYIILLGIFKCHWAMFDCWPTCYMFFFLKNPRISPCESSKYGTDPRESMMYHEANGKSQSIVPVVPLFRWSNMEMTCEMMEKIHHVLWKVHHVQWIYSSSGVVVSCGVFTTDSCRWSVLGCRPFQAASTTTSASAEILRAIFNGNG